MPRVAVGRLLGGCTAAARAKRANTIYNIIHVVRAMYYIVVSSRFCYRPAAHIRTRCQCAKVAASTSPLRPRSVPNAAQNFAIQRIVGELASGERKRAAKCSQPRRIIASLTATATAAASDPRENCVCTIVAGGHFRSADFYPVPVDIPTSQLIFHLINIMNMHNIRDANKMLHTLRSQPAEMSRLARVFGVEMDNIPDALKLWPAMDRKCSSLAQGKCSFIMWLLTSELGDTVGWSAGHRWLNSAGALPWYQCIG